jgi:hypothetical protein
MGITDILYNPNQDIDDEELARRERIATVLLMEERLKSQQLDNIKRQLDLDERSGTMCYIATALAECNRAFALNVEELKAMPVDLQRKIGLTPQQYKGVEEYVRDLLDRLYNKIELNLDSTEEIKARAQLASSASVAQSQRIQSKTAGKKKAKGE